MPLPFAVCRTPPNRLAPNPSTPSSVSHVARSAIAESGDTCDYCGHRPRVGRLGFAEVGFWRRWRLQRLATSGSENEGVRGVRPGTARRETPYEYPGSGWTRRRRWDTRGRGERSPLGVRRWPLSPGPSRPCDTEGVGGRNARIRPVLTDIGASATAGASDADPDQAARLKAADAANTKLGELCVK